MNEIRFNKKQHNHSDEVGDIVIDHLSKTFKTDDKEVVAIKDFSLDIKKGELISVVGPSGCGKTTLLRCIAGLENLRAVQYLPTVKYSLNQVLTEAWYSRILRSFHGGP